MAVRRPTHTVSEEDGYFITIPISPTYTDEVREEAADACAMMASSDARGGPGWPATSYDLGFGRAETLAFLAQASVRRGVLSYRELWAEAEARLRCGWTPGDEP